MGSDSPVLVALGGNALILPGEKGYTDDHFSHSDSWMEPVADLIRQGTKVVLTHGNGPVVGDILLRNECVRERIPAMPLHICVADSQGGTGSMVARSLHNRLRRLKAATTVAVIVTHVVVDLADPAFDEPAKPIGPYYTEASARSSMTVQGWHMREVPGRGWRRLIPSPEPLRIVEIEAIRTALDRGFVPIACGGGGIPVLEGDRGLTGVDAVIDKDLTASLLARELGVGRLIILTDVDGVYRDWGSKEARLISGLSAAEAQVMREGGQFPSGDMGPKIEAALRFIGSGGREVVITSPRLLGKALDGRAGTRITS